MVIVEVRCDEEEVALEEEVGGRTCSCVFSLITSS